MTGSRGQATLEVEALALDRGGVRVLDDVAAGFPSGTVTALVGPSGAGKTSFLRCLNRLEEPSSGRVLLDGADVRTIQPTELRRRVGMIFQVPVLFPGGVAANLRYGLDPTRLSDAQLVEALAAAGLDASFLDRPSAALSVGQAQRVCIARAWVREPEVLLLDEPTSALDRDAALHIEELVVGLGAQGLAIVMVTHDLEQAARVARRALLLVDGTLRAAGSVDEVARAWPARERA